MRILIKSFSCSGHIFFSKNIIFMFHDTFYFKSCIIWTWLRFFLLFALSGPGWHINYYFLDFGLNANNDTVEIGSNCYDTSGIHTATTNNDYLQVTGAYTMNGLVKVPTAYFCGVYLLKQNEVFPGIFSKSMIFG